MATNKLILSILFGVLLLVLSTQSHARGGVFGNIGIYDYPWNISIGYNDYGHGYHKPHYVEHHHYYHKPRYYHHRRHHYRGHGHYKHYKRHHYRGHHSHYRPHHRYHHDYDHRYCRH